jgi:hypothetical protein
MFPSGMLKDSYSFHTPAQSGQDPFSIFSFLNSDHPFFQYHEISLEAFIPLNLPIL